MTYASPDTPEPRLRRGQFSFCDASEAATFWLLDDRGKIVAAWQDTGTSSNVTLSLATLASALAATDAVHIVMAHNHPSGHAAPSMADVDATRHVWRLARMLGASLHDHVIIGRERSFSFRSHGLL